ncbi:MAG: type IV pilin N-terminal domain-containing protein [Euryarchaeota archaeon]|nr:type IV pilin N-terminal domain-containing protein [Euryarchaeota archaeon]
MSFKLSIMKNEDGVTPVLGVMLMIVVTVILAAAVSSFSASIETQDRAPQVTFSASASQTDGYIELNHLGGDTLSHSKTIIELAKGTPLITGYVNMSQVTFAPETSYLRPGDVAKVAFVINTDWQGEPIADFDDENIDMAIKVGTPFRLTVIDKVTGQTVYSTSILLSP